MGLFCCVFFYYCWFLCGLFVVDFFMCWGLCMFLVLFDCLRVCIFFFIFFFFRGGGGCRAGVLRNFLVIFFFDFFVTNITDISLSLSDVI